MKITEVYLLYENTLKYNGTEKKQKITLTNLQIWEKKSVSVNLTFIIFILFCMYIIYINKNYLKRKTAPDIASFKKQQSKTKQESSFLFQSDKKNYCLRLWC